MGIIEFFRALAHTTPESWLYWPLVIVGFSTGIFGRMIFFGAIGHVLRFIYKGNKSHFLGCSDQCDTFFVSFDKLGCDRTRHRCRLYGEDFSMDYDSFRFSRGDSHRGMVDDSNIERAGRLMLIQKWLFLNERTRLTHILEFPI
jgi:hypothetical protein